MHSSEPGVSRQHSEVASGEKCGSSAPLIHMVGTFTDGSSAEQSHSPAPGFFIRSAKYPRLSARCAQPYTGTAKASWSSTHSTIDAITPPQEMPVMPMLSAIIRLSARSSACAPSTADTA